VDRTEGLKTFLNVHVVYELEQLENALALALREPVPGGRMNAYIESWTVHASFEGLSIPRNSAMMTLTHFII
jgi:hypothetical protein